MRRGGALRNTLLVLAAACLLLGAVVAYRLATPDRSLHRIYTPTGWASSSPAPGEPPASPAVE